MTPLKILFFINGNAPTAADIAKANTTLANVCFRNANALVRGAPLEFCDGIMGDAPRAYASKFVSSGEALANRAVEVEKLTVEFNDERAPRRGPETITLRGKKKSGKSEKPDGKKIERADGWAK